MKSQTIPLSVIAKKWADALAHDNKIEAFCQKYYGKSIKLFIGYDDAQAPKEEDCPCAIVMMQGKTEGVSESYSYALEVVWGIYQENTTTDDNVTIFNGAFESDDLGQLIIECLMNVNPSFPIVDINYESDNISWRPIYPGRAELTITMPHVIGGIIEY